MASFMNYFGGRRDPKQSARDAIVGLRTQLQMIEKKEEHLMKKIDDEQRKAKANVTTNKAGSSYISISALPPPVSSSTPHLSLWFTYTYEADTDS